MLHWRLEKYSIILIKKTIWIFFYPITLDDLIESGATNPESNNHDKTQCPQSIQVYQYFTNRWHSIYRFQSTPSPCRGRSIDRRHPCGHRIIQRTFGTIDHLAFNWV